MSREGDRGQGHKREGTLVWLVPQSPAIMEGEDRIRLIPGIRAGRRGSDQEDRCGVGRAEPKRDLTVGLERKTSEVSRARQVGRGATQVSSGCHCRI